MCKFISGFLFFLAFTVNLNIFATKSEPKSEPEPKPFRVAFYMDDFEAEWKDGPTDKDTITKGFSVNLYQNASDVIIVSIGILKNFITRLRSGEEKNEFFKSIKFDIGKWNIYNINDSKFYALVLKYKEHAVKASNIVKIDKWKIVSDAQKIFSENLKEISRLNSLKNIFVTEQDLRDDENFYDKFVKKFIEKWGTSASDRDIKDLKRTSFLPPMNIVLNGHGNVGQAIAGMDSGVMTEVLNFLNELNVNAALIFSCSAGGKNLDFMQFRKDLDDKKISMNLNYLLIVSAISDASVISSYVKEIKADKDIDPSTDIKGFFEAFETPKTKIKEPSFLTNILKKLTLSENWFLMESGINNIPQVLIPNVGWFQYFDIDPDIQKITDASIAKLLAKPEFKPEEEAEIVDTRTGIPLLKKVKITPLKAMKFAETGTIYINQKLALLLYPAIIPVELKFSPKKFDIENGAVNLGQITIGGKIFNNRSQIHDWLKTWSTYLPTIDSVNTDWAKGTKSLYFYPSIISMQRGDALHLLSKVSVESAVIAGGKKTGILSFIRNSFLNLQGRESQKTFFIKELKGYNDISTILDIIGSSNGFKQALLSSKNTEITLKNLFIKTSFNLKNDRSDIEIVFEFAGKYWNFKTQSSLYKALPGVGPVWAFSGINRGAFIDKLGEFGFNFFIDLNLNDYIKQISDLKNLYQSGIKQVLKESGVSVQEKLSLKDYLLKLDFDKFKEYVNLGKSFVVTKTGLGADESAALKTKLKKLKISLGNLKFKLNALQQKLVILKRRLSGEKVGAGVAPEAEVQKVAAKEAFAIIKSFGGKKFTPVDLKSLAEKFTLVSNRIKDDIAISFSKQRFVGKGVETLKIELVESVNLNDSAFDKTQKLNLSYILVSLIHNLYFKSTKFTKVTDLFKGGDFASDNQLATLVLENVYQIMHGMNALDNSKFYGLGGGYITVVDESGIVSVLRNETEKILNKFLDMLMVSSNADQSKYKAQVIALNDFINSLSAGESMINMKLKALNEKFKLLDTDMKIVFGQILISKLTADLARSVWTEILKLLNLTQDKQSIGQNSQFFDLYGLGISILLKYYDEINNQDKNIVGYLGSRISYELDKDTDYNNISKQYFYFGLARFFAYVDFNSPSKTNTLIKNVLDLDIKEYYQFEVAFDCVSRYKYSNPGLYGFIINSNFHKNLEITKFDTESFTLKSGNQYFYKDLNSLRFAFNLATYFLITEFDSGKNSDWIVNGVRKSEYLHPVYKNAIKQMILGGATPYFESLKARLVE